MAQVFAATSAQPLADSAEEICRCHGLLVAISSSSLTVTVPEAVFVRTDHQGETSSERSAALIWALGERPSNARSARGRRRGARRSDPPRAAAGEIDNEDVESLTGGQPIRRAFRLDCQQDLLDPERESHRGGVRSSHGHHQAVAAAAATKRAFWAASQRQGR